MDEIRDLTHEQAAEIYRQKYWLAYSCDQMPWPINVVHFDCCVNIGNTNRYGWHGRANRILQRAANVRPDGRLGPITLAAVGKDPTDIAQRAMTERREYYQSLATTNPVMGKYLVGWNRRVDDLQRVIQEAT